ncbi:MAG TPA: hypothetical protein VE843_15920, partial [Ktedonobacteraceae bacterium]|nr:hypothetical protein [Ktedonobacteraceae bacterium]
GYVQHNDGYTLHYPGDTADMQERVKELRNHAYIMREMPVPAYRMYGEPLITATTPKLTWQGVEGAFWYTIERSTSGVSGPWVQLCVKCTDNETPWMDTSRPGVGRAWYKIEASNLSETGVYSAIEEDQQLPVRKL